MDWTSGKDEVSLRFNKFQPSLAVATLLRCLLCVCPAPRIPLNPAIIVRERYDDIVTSLWQIILVV
jgi:hypothetical protein